MLLYETGLPCHEISQYHCLVVAAFCSLSDVIFVTASRHSLHFDLPYYYCESVCILTVQLLLLLLSTFIWRKIAQCS